MSEIDESQVTPEAPEQNAAPVAEEPKEQSFEQELAEARKSDEPETPVEEGEKPVEAAEEKPAEEEEPKSPESEEVKPEETEAERKQRFYEMRQAQKQQREIVEQSISQQLQPQPADELVNGFMEQGYSQFEAEMLARDERRNQQAEINTASVRVAELNMQFGTEAVQVMHDFPVFDPNSPEYDKDYATRASRLFESHAGVQKDKATGAIISASETPYNFYKELADMRNSGMSKAQVAAQKAVEQQMASVAPPASTAPVKNESAEDKQASSLEAALNAVK